MRALIRWTTWPGALWAALVWLPVAGVPAASAADAPCERLERALLRTGDPDPADCLGGAALAGVTAGLPKGLRIAAVRGLYVDDGGGYRGVDPRTGPVDLDRADANGDSVAGALLLSGRLVLTGRLRYEASNGWHWLFVPDRPLGGAATAFQRALAIVALDRDDGAPWATPPAALAGESCWEALATLRIGDAVVLMGDGESAGMQPVAARLSKVRDHRACAPPDTAP